ncbi:MAG: tryptophan 7-halogenase [Rhodothalassiaceae bacterium]
MHETGTERHDADRIRSVLILGGGTAGWMAAAVLAKSFGRALDIALVESDDIGIIGVGEATIPQIRTLNAFLGIDEDDFVRRTRASFKLGIAFEGWYRPDSRYIHAFGDIGQPLGILPYHHYWLRARALGSGIDLWDASLNARAAFAERMGRIERVGDTRLGGIRHAFHFDAGLYAKVLRGLAEGLGVVRHEGIVTDVALDGTSGHIRTLKLRDGREIGADFFIDCSGFRGRLIASALGIGYEDWSRWLPVDRAIAVPCAHDGRMRPYTQAIAREAGWQWRIPLQHRTGNGHVYVSALLSDEKAHAILMANLEGEALAEPRLLRFTTGIRSSVWHKNCVALGLASGFLEPLESTSIHLIQSFLGRFVQHFPRHAGETAPMALFNRQCRFEMERIRDFLILHYHANQRRGEDFWDDRREMAIPDTLAGKIALFRESGRIVREGDELFTETGWLQLLIGQGILPESWHPLADTLSESDLLAFHHSIAKIVARTAESLPTHAEFVAGITAQAESRRKITSS